MRRFTYLAAVSLIALVVVAKVTLFGHPARTEAALASVDSGMSSDWNIQGQIQEMNGTFWTIQGFTVQVNSDTRISGVVPTIGTFAAADGVVRPDATWLATRIRVSDRDDFTPTAVTSPTATATAVDTVPSTPTPTSTVVSTIPNTPTPTATAVPATPTFTPTSVATATKVSDPDDENDDGDQNDQDENGDDKSDVKDKSGPPPHPNLDNPGKHLGIGKGQGQDDHGKAKASKGKKDD